jgi:hypothetical protein
MSAVGPLLGTRPLVADAKRPGGPMTNADVQGLLSARLSEPAASGHSRARRPGLLRLKSGKFRVVRL